jgi:hypothetical protein
MTSRQTRPTTRTGKKRQQKRSGKEEVLVRETTRIATRPRVEIRPAATLSQALTEPAVAVVKPEKTVTRVVRSKTRRAA